MDKRVQKCAEILERPFLQAKLLNGDMTAQDIVYHRKCLTGLYKKVNAAQLNGCYNKEKCQLHGLAFSQRVAFLKENVYYSTDKNTF